MALHRYRIHKPTHGGQEWLNIRFKDEEGNKRVSASAVAAIYGLHPFVPMDKYAAELLGDVAPKPIPPNPAMERGNRLEPFILEWASDKLNIPFTTPEEMFACDSDNGARMVATLDGFYEGEIQGEHEYEFKRIILEIKTTTRPWEGTLPDYWRIQGIQQAICADTDSVIWAVFDPSMILHIYTQDITEAEKDEHIKAVETWLNAIEMGITPGDVKWSYETVATRFAASTPTTIELGETAAELVANLRHIRSELKSYTALEDEVRAKLCELIGENEVATINGQIVATWKGRSWDSLDIKGFKAAHPELAKKFSKPTTTRTFLLKGER